MSKTKAALVTMFVLASSSAAMASPRVSVSAKAQFSYSLGHNGSASAPAPISRTRTYPAYPIRQPVRYPAAPYSAIDSRHGAFVEDYGHPVAPHTWMALGTVTEVVNGGELQTFDVSRWIGSISKIKLQSHGGKSRIFAVTVNFADGRSQTFALDRYVGVRGTVDLPASPSYTIELAGNRRVTSIVVDGLNATNSSYSVLAF